MALNIAHIVNPVKVDPGNELYTAQPITFETMKTAAEMVKDKMQLSLFTAQFPEDHEIIPTFFTKTPDLLRSVSDLYAFASPHKLPLLADILERLYEASNADYLVYTNVDIALMPFFYETIAQIINQGYDAFAINRRRVSSKYKEVAEIPLLYADIGRPHPGFDCFVFHRSLYPKLKLGNICIGIPFIEATMIYNLAAVANNFKLFDDQHLTIHIGLEVMPARDKEYYWYNRRQFNVLLKEIKPLLKHSNLPYSEVSIFRKALNWSLNPGIFIALNSEVEAKGFWNRVRAKFNEVRFRILQRY